MAVSNTDATLTGWIRLIRSEFDEMPGLVLTCPQIQRMWGIDCDTCHRATKRLVVAGFLERRPDGSYARPSDMHVVREP